MGPDAKLYGWDIIVNLHDFYQKRGRRKGKRRRKKEEERTIPLHISVMMEET